MNETSKCPPHLMVHWSMPELSLEIDECRLCGVTKWFDMAKEGMLVPKPDMIESFHNGSVRLRVMPNG